MSLSAKDMAVVKGFWNKIAPKADEIGGEALGRMLRVFPQTKAYFAHWKDTSPNSPEVKKHGALILATIGDVVNRIENMTTVLGSLSDLHAFKLRVDPANFKILGHNIMVVICMTFPNDFTPEVHLSVDKFFQNFTLALSERYR
ncbi:hemoglobin anodic subunit alpha [Anguilla anguilla]|uniref:Hemoglobin anodic subunit alpha n=3 Tax=Anguilla anguilla TaxID=7936 RepID=HBAA_ANGAN|nr:hemoglobin anodic subunit alpha [Anguilla anguilla]P80945.2 RecName: Full=Hemoglobin anodic subunit alpha; AltName: Full=Hemoglobin anodic alpha chain [Anguilla anguilla]KAG5832166.1 hypothetical protein ANANG_G00288210 [Anguilla anguilla]